MTVSAANPYGSYSGRSDQGCGVARIEEFGDIAGKAAQPTSSRDPKNRRACKMYIPPHGLSCLITTDENSAFAK